MNYIGTMNVSLPGINRIKKKLADGRVVTYYYAWKGGPPLKGKPGSQEFIASYYDAHKSRPAKPSKTLLDLLNQYASSRYFDKELQPSTQIKTLRFIRRLKREKDPIGELPISTLSDSRTEEILLTWRDNIAINAPGTARVYWGKLSGALTWATKQRPQIIKSNPCLGADPMHQGSRIDYIWLEDQIAKFCKEGPSFLVIAFMIALWTGQREGSLVKLRWSAYDGQYLMVEQEKQKRNAEPKVVTVPVMGSFKKFLDGLERQAGIVGLSKEERQERHILLTSRGKPWASAASFSVTFSLAVSKIVENRTFHDLRGTAITRLARAGCTVPEIATITGHSLKTVQDILDKHYLHRDVVLATQAMTKRDVYENSQLPSQLLEMV